jgi:hypothetical protein
VPNSVNAAYILPAEAVAVTVNVKAVTVIHSHCCLFTSSRAPQQYKLHERITASALVCSKQQSSRKRSEQKLKVTAVLVYSMQQKVN